MLTWASRTVAWPLWELDNGTRILPALRELERTQWLDETTLRQRQWTRLVSIVREAEEHCDYYRGQFHAHGVSWRDLSTPAQYATFPILTKSDVQRSGDRLINHGYTIPRLVQAKTGGSTGKAVTVYADAACRDLRHAAAIRSDRWAGWNLGVRRAALWGNAPTPATWRAVIRRMLRDRIVYLDTMEMNDATMTAFVGVWRRYRPEVLFGHSHSLYVWARWLEAHGSDDLRPRGIISTSMTLLPSERAVIERVFACRVTDRYGCEETGLIACECERHEGMHVNVDHVYLELVKEDGQPAQPGETGTVVVTDLMNRGMPLIRYRLEDLAVASGRQCACGRGLPLIEAVSGRIADFLVRADGALVAGVSLVERTLTALPGIEQMQIVQNGIDDLTLNIVRMAGYTEDTALQLTRELHRVFGAGARIRLQYLDQLPAHASGKHRFSICNVPRQPVAV
jgi:phenylacetate-CoA ligase